MARSLPSRLSAVCGCRKDEAWRWGEKGILYYSAKSLKVTFSKVNLVYNSFGQICPFSELRSAEKGSYNTTWVFFWVFFCEHFCEILFFCSMLRQNSKVRYVWTEQGFMLDTFQRKYNTSACTVHSNWNGKVAEGPYWALPGTAQAKWPDFKKTKNHPFAILRRS